MKRFSNILFVAEGDTDNAPALARAAALADHNQAQLTVVGIVSFGSFALDRGLRDALVQERKDQLDQLAQTVSLGRGSIETKLLIGKAFIEIIREVLRFDRDLVIKSHIDPGLLSVGGPDKKLLRKCPCPVWILRSTEERRFRQILLALDYEPTNPENESLNRQLLEMAVSLAISEFAELHIVHAWLVEHEAFLRSPRSGLSNSDVDAMVQHEENQRRLWLEDLLNDTRRPLGGEMTEFLKPQLHVIRGYAEKVVPECARRLGAELIVMGTLGRTGIPGFVIGNTAEAIINNIDCSVLAVKPAGFVSPVTADDPT